MRRLVIGAVLATVMFAGMGTGVAFAHPDAAYDNANPDAIGSEPLLKAGFAAANGNGQAGIVQGFVAHALTCAGHNAAEGH